MNASELVGQRFGRLVVTSPALTGRHLLNCQCDCGQSKVIYAYSLVRGTTRSCGCLRREISAAAVRARVGPTPAPKHGYTRVGRMFPEYMVWQNMKHRCLNTTDISYPNYGAKGVTVCDRWNPKAGGSFDNFLADMGERPEGTTLGRFGDIGNYELNNCKWMTSAEQVANRRPDRKSRSKRSHNKSPLKGNGRIQ